MSSSGIVLVTGATGFVGSHVVHQLLEAGYRVRGTARSAKVSSAQDAYASYGNRYEVIGIDDLARGDFSRALEGVNAVIHTAAPISSKITSPAEALEAAIEGSLNILRQAEKLGIRKFVYVSSIITVGFVGSNTGEVTDQMWTPVSREKALDGKSEPIYIYATEKTLAEQAVWEFADKHPHVDVTSVNPPYIYGPFAPGYRNDDAILTGLSTNRIIYNLLFPDGPVPPTNTFIDVRDVAYSLVAALDSPPTSQVGRKRILMSGEWFSTKEAVEYLALQRPEIKDRLTKLANDAPPAPKSPINNARAEEVLGLKFRGWREGVLEAVDDLLRIEGEWKAKGLTPK